MKLNLLNKNKRIFTNLKSVIFARWADETTIENAYAYVVLARSYVLGIDNLLWNNA